VTHVLTAEAVKSKARELGFDACGICAATTYPELTFFADWVARGYAASMEYLTRSVEARSDIRHVLPSAKSVIVTATVYNTDRPYSTEIGDAERAHIARYAWGDDYHEVIGRRLDRLVAWMHEMHPEPFNACGYVDTGPIQERVYAQNAGVGWIGKNSCVIHPELGSWIFLAEVVSDLPFEPDPPSFEQCGGCTRCLEACPTQAIVEPGVIDAGRCISYLTIEHRGEIPAPLQTSIGTHVYGCDICQDVCPWNEIAPVSNDRAWQPRPAWDGVSVGDLETLPDDALLSALRRSPMKRATTAGIRRNIATARANRTGSGAGE
jgi:epoxyqueuosine reductase